MIRDFGPPDTPQVIDLLMTQFPEEERILGTRPEMVIDIVKRVYRPWARFVLGVLRLVGKPVFKLLVVEDGGKAVATTLLSYPARSVYLSMVVVHPSVRRRGYAVALLERARELAHKGRRQFLVLDVLADNTPARQLYEGRLGYRTLRRNAFLVRELGDADSPAPSGKVRPFQASDERPLVEIAQAQLPPLVGRVLPRKASGLRASRVETSVLGGERATWVVAGATGPQAGLGVAANAHMEAAQIVDPIVGTDADPAAVGEMVRTAAAWARAHGAKRLVGQVPEHNVAGRAALEREGFHEEIAAFTLYLPVT